MSAICCHDLFPSESARVDVLDGAIAGRFVARGVPVGTCYGVGVGAGRLLCFGDAGGRVLGSVLAADFLAVPVEQAADAITVWRD